MVQNSSRSIFVKAAVIFIVVAVVVNGLPQSKNEASVTQTCCEQCLENQLECPTPDLSSDGETCKCIIDIGTLQLRERRSSNETDMIPRKISMTE